MSESFVLPEGLPKPIADDLDAPYWEAAARGELVAQRCNACGGWQWTAEYLCHRCPPFDLGLADEGSRAVQRRPRLVLRSHGSILAGCPASLDLRLDLLLLLPLPLWK